MSDSGSSNGISRREMLVKASRLAAAAAVAPIIAACGAQATATPTTAPKPAAAATTAPAAAPAAPTAVPAAAKAAKITMANFGAIPDGWKTLGAEFTKANPTVTVEFEAVQANVWGEYFDKLVTQIAAGTPPDLCRVAIEGVQLFASRGLAIPLDDYINKDKAELAEYFTDVHPQLVKYMQYKGKQYQLPFTWNGPVIHYNTKLFKEAGIERPKDDWTQQDFLDIAKKLTKGDVFGFGFANAYWGSAIPWFFVAGSDLLNDDWTKSTANDPKTIEAVQFMHDLIWVHKVSPQPAGFDFNAAFIAGKIAMGGFTGGNGRLTFINGGLKDFDTLYFPKWRTQTHEFGGTGFPIIKGSKSADAAWALTKFLVKKESITSFVNAVAQTPARRSVAYTGWVKAGEPPEHFKIYYDALDKPSKAVPAPPEYNETESIFLRHFTLVTANEKTAEQAMNDCHKELAAMYAKRAP